MMHSIYLEAIKNSEGFSPQSFWDYAQNTNGYGTKARFPGEVIDRVEAEQRFQTEMSGAEAMVESFAPGLDEGSKAALSSLTFNAGTAWMSSGLGDAIKRGDLDEARNIFLQYNKAGGAPIAGLVQRRLSEVTWFGQPSSAAVASSQTAVAADQPMPAKLGNSVSQQPTSTAEFADQMLQPQPVTASPKANRPTSGREIATVAALRSGMSSTDVLALLSLLSAQPLTPHPHAHDQNDKRDRGRTIDRLLAV